MRPLYERILIKPRAKETVTSGGIRLPEKAVKRVNIGTVVSCGEGNQHNPMKVKPDDIVLFNRYAGLEINVGGELHFVVLSNEVIAILDSLDEVTLSEFD